MKRTGLLAMLTAGVMLVGAGCGKAGVQKGGTAITVGDINVTMNDVSLFLTKGEGFDESKKMWVENIENTLKYGELGKKMEDIELTQEDKDNIVSMRAYSAKAKGGRTEYEEFVKRSGSSMEFVDAFFTAAAYEQKVSEKISAEAGEPTDAEYAEYFKDNYYRAKHILIPITEEAAAEAAEGAENAEPTATPVADEEGRTGEELANSLLDRAKNGEDFDALIKQFNQDPGVDGSPDGYIFADNGEMAQEFVDCVKSLEPGEFGICQTTFGYHIIERLPLEDTEAGFASWLNEKKEAMSQELNDRKIKEKLDEYCEQYGISFSINQEAVDAFTEKMLVD